MVCDKCHISLASVVVNHVINGHASVFHFCERCAEEQGLLGGGIMFKLPMPNFGLVIPSNFYHDRQGSPQLQEVDNQFETMVLEPLAEKEGRGETCLEKKISGLKQEKDKAIKNEDYQSAAMLRDRIKELKKQLQ